MQNKGMQKTQRCNVCEHRLVCPYIGCETRCPLFCLFDDDPRIGDLKRTKDLPLDLIGSINDVILGIHMFALN